MSRSRAHASHKSRRQILAWVASVAGLLGASYWAWRRGHRVGRPIVAVDHDAEWLPANASHRWKCIVIHHSACEVGSAAAFDEAHRKRGWDGLGYDFVIGNGTESADGEVEVGFRWTRQIAGAHCKTADEFYNEHGIGICLVGNFNLHAPDPTQLRSLTRLVRFLCMQFRIPVSAIHTHGGITGKTECPGSHFDLQDFVILVESGDNSTMRL